jgi:hypothetical protein
MYFRFTEMLFIEAHAREPRSIVFFQIYLIKDIYQTDMFSLAERF